MANLFIRLSLIIIAVLITVLLFGPPLAIAKNLPTICNLFDKKMADKSGSCGNRAIFSKIQDKSFDLGAILFSYLDLETSHFRVVKRNSTAPAFSSAINTQSNPLRC